MHEQIHSPTLSASVGIQGKRLIHSDGRCRTEDCRHDEIHVMSSARPGKEAKCSEDMLASGIALRDLVDYLAMQGFPCRIDGSPDITIQSVNMLQDAGEGDISFLPNEKYVSTLATTAASAVIITEEQEKPAHLTVLRCADPYAAITAVIMFIHGCRQHPQWGQHASASIAQTARIGPNANIGADVSIAAGVTIGANATIYPGCYVGDNAIIGDEVILYPNVVIYEGCQLGDRVTLHSGTVIGEDGFGYAWSDGARRNIPAASKVVIEDDVEFGSNCSVNNALMGKTVIGKGTKLSGSVVIGHGVRIGEHCMIVAQVGIAGSATTGDHASLAEQVSVCGHLDIGDNVVVDAKSVVWSSIEPGQHYPDYPAVQLQSDRKQEAAAQRTSYIW